MKDLTFREFSRMNRERCESVNGFNHDLQSWSASDWMTAVVGELGEAANYLKKLNRIRNGVPGNAEDETQTALKLRFRKEVADTFIYLDLLAQSCGFDLVDVVTAKFTETSQKIGYSE